MLKSSTKYPPELGEQQKEFLLAEINNYSILHGLAVKPSTAWVSRDVDPSRSLAVTAPVTLFPSLFPRACFEEAQTIQAAYNDLYVAIINDNEWLRTVVEEYVRFFSSAT